MPVVADRGLWPLFDADDGLLMLSTLAASLSGRCNQPPILRVGVLNHCGSIAAATGVQHLLQSLAWYRMSDDGSSVASGQ